MVAPETNENAAWDRLRQTREDKGLTLEDAARVTRIASGYLRALEQGRFDKLPSDAYARGFLRAYGHFLGFSEIDLQDLYHLVETSNLSVSEEEEYISKTSSAERILKRNGMIVAMVFAAVVAAFIFYASSTRKNGQPAGDSMPGRARLEGEKTLRDTGKNGVANTKKSIANEDTTTAMPFSHSISPEKGIILRLKAVEDGSLDINIDDTVSQHYDLKAGDIIEWKAAKTFSLDLQNGGGVEAEFNGKLLGPFGVKGSPAHIVLTADDSKGEATP